MSRLKREYEEYKRFWDSIPPEGIVKHGVKYTKHGSNLVTEFSDGATMIGAAPKEPSVEELRHEECYEILTYCSNCGRTDAVYIGRGTISSLEIGQLVCGNCGVKALKRKKWSDE